jgi:hypothetical protein
MPSRWIAELLSLCAAGLLAVPCAGAWEIRLRADVTVDAAVVRLGDVAEVVGADPVTHAGIERVVLAPGPTPSRRRVLSGGEIRRALAYRGVDLETCRFTGAPAVVVFGRGAAPDSGSPPGVVERPRGTITARPPPRPPRGGWSSCWPAGWRPSPARRRGRSR